MNEKQRSEAIDEIQSARYQFPYHYVPRSAGFPYFSKFWRYAPSYIAAIRLTETWLNHISKMQNHKHMDFGCGDGGFINALVELIDVDTMQIEGIDYDEKAIRWAKLLAENPEIFRAGDIQELEAGKYDTGTLIEVFEHIPPSEGGWFVEQIAKALREDGLLFVTVPSNEKPVSAKHYRHFDFETLRQCFGDFFEVQEIFGFEKETIAQRLLEKLTMNRYVFLETRFTSEFWISQFASKHKRIDGCGRIGMILKKK